MTPTTRISVRAERPYEVVIGRGLDGDLRQMIGFDARRVAIVHPTILRERAQRMRTPLADEGLEVHLIEVPDGESAKTADVLTFCWSVLGDSGFTRSDVVVGFGGGATTDLAGFVAASWLRGVRCVTVPTTVLGMVDAAVGGKTGINTAHGKNLVGAFHEPAGVVCDLSALETLPERELRSGLAEIIKCGFIADPSILDDVEFRGREAADPTSPLLADLVRRGIEVKARTVSADLRESGGTGDDIGREALNYGHTLGHAIERYEDHQIRHGEAISIGMVFVAELATRTGAIDVGLLDRHRRVLAQAGLPTTYRSMVWDHLLGLMRLDKKTRGDQLRFVILQRARPTSLVPDVARPPGRTVPTILAGPDEALLREAYQAICD